MKCKRCPNEARKERTLCQACADKKKKEDRKRRGGDGVRSDIRTIKISKLIEEQRLDVKKIITEGIALIPIGELAFDDVFRRDLGISSDKWKDYSDDPAFDDNKARLPNKKVVWGPKETIDDLRLQDGVQ